jgi:endonuclease/exonuclease/phosphatase family metal-dependent hydrolase
MLNALRRRRAFAEEPGHVCFRVESLSPRLAIGRTLPPERRGKRQWYKRLMRRGLLLLSLLLACSSSTPGNPDSGSSAPETNLTSSPAALTNESLATFEFSSPTATRFVCSVDGASFQPCASPFNVRLADGDHQFAVAAELSGVQDASPATASFTIDTVAPDTTISSAPSGTVNSTDATFSFSSNETGSTFTCSLDGAAFASCTSPASYSGLANGTHTFAVRATDLAGNVDATAAGASWTVAVATLPDTSIDSGPPSVTSDRSATFTFSSNDPRATFSCFFDGATLTPCTSPKSFTTLAEGQHTFRVTATNATGSDPTPASVTWTVDLTPPDTTITSGPSGTTSFSTATFRFTSTETGSTFLCSLDSATPASCTSGVSYSGLSATGHTFSVYAVDAAGNADPSPATASWTVGAGSSVEIRLMAANLSTGNNQSYDDGTLYSGSCVQKTYGAGEGKRLIEAMKPDIVMIQEFNYFGCDGKNDTADAQSFVDQLSASVGFTYNWYREPLLSGAIPNGILTRYPIVSSGQWTDTVQTQPNRSFTYAEIAIPGPVHLWAISVHLLTSSATNRANETSLLLNTYIKPNIPAGDYVVIGGDYNTQSRTEQCIVNLQNDFVTTGVSGQFPQDQNGNDRTNSTRATGGHPEDWVLANNALDPYATTVHTGAESFPYGLVLDSSVYNSLGELSDIQPALAGDSHAPNMQHMGIVRDFLVPQ